MNPSTSTWRSKLTAMLSSASSEEDAPAGNEARPGDVVLVVDDDADWGIECAFTLETLGYSPIVAGDADAAIETFDAHPVSIAIVDYNMPGQDGISLIHNLKQMADEKGRLLHIIMATGYATKDVAVGAMRASAVDFLEKPVRQEDLRKALLRISGLRDAPPARQTLIRNLSNLSSELQRLTMLMEPAPATPHDAAAPAPPSPAAPATQRAEEPGRDGDLTRFIRELLRKEAMRRNIGDGTLFGDPTWEMLLDLLLASIEDRKVSVSSACIASGAPMSTALRLVRRLVAEDVLCRIPDQYDKRRNFLIINPKVERLLVDHLIGQLRQQPARGG